MSGPVDNMLQMIDICQGPIDFGMAVQVIALVEVSAVSGAEVGGDGVRYQHRLTKRWLLRQRRQLRIKQLLVLHCTTSCSTFSLLFHLDIATHWRSTSPIEMWSLRNIIRTQLLLAQLSLMAWLLMGSVVVENVIEGLLQLHLEQCFFIFVFVQFTAHLFDFLL